MLGFGLGLLTLFGLVEINPGRWVFVMRLWGYAIRVVLERQRGRRCLWSVGLELELEEGL